MGNDSSMPDDMPDMIRHHLLGQKEEEEKEEDLPPFSGDLVVFNFRGKFPDRFPLVYCPVCHTPRLPPSSATSTVKIVFGEQPVVETGMGCKTCKDVHSGTCNFKLSFPLAAACSDPFPTEPPPQTCIHCKNELKHRKTKMCWGPRKNFKERFDSWYYCGNKGCVGKNIRHQHIWSFTEEDKAAGMKDKIEKLKKRKEELLGLIDEEKEKKWRVKMRVIQNQKDELQHISKFHSKMISDLQILNKSQEWRESDPDNPRYFEKATKTFEKKKTVVAKALLQVKELEKALKKKLEERATNKEKIKKELSEINEELNAHREIEDVIDEAPPSSMNTFAAEFKEKANILNALTSKEEKDLMEIVNKETFDDSSNQTVKEVKFESESSSNAMTPKEFCE